MRGAVVEREGRPLARPFEGGAPRDLLAALDVQRRQRLQSAADLREGQGLAVAPLQRLHPGRERDLPGPARDQALKENGVKFVSRS